MDENRCIVCGEIKREGKTVVDNPLPKHIEDLLQHAKTLVESGEIKYQVLARYEEKLSAKEKASLRYHRVCRQGVLKSKRPATPVGGYTTPQYKDKWKYSGKLTEEYHRPPLLSFLLQSMLFGQHAPSSNRIGEINNTVNDLGQVLSQNVATDRQVKHTPQYCPSVHYYC